jgi:hypothetical protein
MRRVRIKTRVDKRMTSGPLQFNNDPPGVYLSLIDAIFLRRVLADPKFAIDNPTLKNSLARFVKIINVVIATPPSSTIKEKDSDV